MSHSVHSDICGLFQLYEMRLFFIATIKSVTAGSISASAGPSSVGDLSPDTHICWDTQNENAKKNLDMCLFFAVDASD